MFKVNDYVVFEKNGVCKIEEIGTLDVNGVPKDKIYYKMVPLYSKGSRVYAPIENRKTVMRDVISREDAEQLIKEIPEIEMMQIVENRNLEIFYKEAMRKYECREWIKIIKTLHLKKKEREKQGKKMTGTEEKYLRAAEDSLYGELAIPLSLPKEGVEEYITEKLAGIAEK